jgi:hypothetical protein
MSTAFLQSEQKIYSTIKWRGFAEKLMKSDIMSRLAKIESLGYYWDADTLKLRTQPFRVISKSTPWCHGTYPSTKRCGLDHHVIFNGFGIIPEGCMECWKICATIPTFDALMKMKEWQKTYDGPCKCGMELRDYAPKHYGAYFYHDSLDEGRENYTVLKERIADEVDPDIHIILKRACTEFEFIKGPSPLWVRSEGEDEMIKLIETYVNDDASNTRQEQLLADHVVLKWFIWAHSHGDFSYLPYNEGEKLFPEYVTYHEGDLDGIKRDIATCRAFQKHGVPSDVANQVLDANFKLADELKLHPDVILNMAGNGPNTIRFDNPSILGEPIPKELQGDDDRSEK